MTIASFPSGDEVKLARGFLESNGIEVFLADENMARNYPLWAVIGGVKLQVRAKEEETARALLAGVKSDSSEV